MTPKMKIIEPKKKRESTEIYSDSESKTKTNQIYTHTEQCAMCTCYDDERNYSQIKTYPNSEEKTARIKRCIFDNDKFKARIVIPSAISVL